MSSSAFAPSMLRVPSLAHPAPQGPSAVYPAAQPQLSGFPHTPVLPYPPTSQTPQEYQHISYPLDLYAYQAQESTPRTPAAATYRQPAHQSMTPGLYGPHPSAPSVSSSALLASPVNSNVLNEVHAANRFFQQFPTGASLHQVEAVECTLQAARQEFGRYTDEGKRAVVTLVYHLAVAKQYLAEQAGALGSGYYQHTLIKYADLIA